jgi:hypothetical protein
MTHSLQAIVAAAVQSTPFQEKVAVPLMVALIGFTGVLATVTITTVAGRWAQATNRRRDAYAAAIATLVAWAEYPYRIRRRTSDDPVELARLAGLGGDLQERLRCHQTWITTESRWVANIYKQAIIQVSSRVSPANRDAWMSPAITMPAAMNLNGWGPGDLLPIIEWVQSAIACRFSWRRLVGVIGLHPGVPPARRQPSQVRDSQHSAQIAPVEPSSGGDGV